jgi:mevalonate kinase
MGIKKDIIDNTISDLEKSFNSSKGDLTTQQKQDFESLKSTVETSLDKQLKPLIDDAIIPLLKQVIELNKAVSKINSNLPRAFSSIGAGSSAAGPAGASTYSGSAPTADLNKVTRELAELKRIVE